MDSDGRDRLANPLQTHRLQRAPSRLHSLEDQGQGEEMAGGFGRQHGEADVEGRDLLAVRGLAGTRGGLRRADSIATLEHR